MQDFLTIISRCEIPSQRVMKEMPRKRLRVPPIFATRDAGEIKRCSVLTVMSVVTIHTSRVR
jgi:hypothetical protein